MEASSFKVLVRLKMERLDRYLRLS